MNSALLEHLHTITGDASAVDDYHQQRTTCNQTNNNQTNRNKR
jgi:hypothetical protein